MVLQNIAKSTNTKALITSMTLAISFVIVRSIARWYKGKSFATEDYFCWFGLTCFVTMCSLYLTILDPLYNSQAVAAGVIPAPPNLLDEIRFLMGRFYAIQLLFWLTLWSVKFSLLWIFRRLVIGLPLYNRIWLGIVVFTALTLAGCEVSQLLTCDGGMKAYFTPGACQGPGDARRQAGSLYYSLTVDVLTDLLIMVIPIRLLWNLQITFVEKISVGVAFIFGFITIVCAIIRAVSLKSAAGQEKVIPITWLILWASIEGLAAIIVNCLPTFAIFFRARVVSSRTYNSRSHRYNQQRSISIPSRRRASNIPLDDIVVEAMDPVLQQYRERAQAGHHRVGVSTQITGKKDLTGRDWSATRSQKDADNSSQESIIGMTRDHLTFEDGDKDGVLVTRTVVVG
ncbi:hypothetical protein D0Z07_8938 [Hyphodiscus hymeniophilus]|uniref:Rhodopsin domain-containing protein n=1 Tax=Hyphodiscus hymeniophilus TaxID=353542 RepID=A0A9P6SKL2_9HELO|nr:hypothetical protein D0Z07_8938 [Hyphodiscus hymeniophilus]